MVWQFLQLTELDVLSSPSVSPRGSPSFPIWVPFPHCILFPGQVDDATEEKESAPVPPGKEKEGATDWDGDAHMDSKHGKKSDRWVALRCLGFFDLIFISLKILF